MLTRRPRRVRRRNDRFPKIMGMGFSLIRASKSSQSSRHDRRIDFTRPIVGARITRARFGGRNDHEEPRTECQRYHDNVQRLTDSRSFDRRSAGGAWRLALGARRSALGARRSALDARRSSLAARRSPLATNGLLCDACYSACARYTDATDDRELIISLHFYEPCHFQYFLPLSIFFCALCQCSTFCYSVRSL